MIDLTIKTLDSQNHAFSVDDDITVSQFKERIAEVINIPVESQRLIYCGRVLQDNKKLQEYDVNGKVVHLVQRAPPSTTRRTRSPQPSTQPLRRPFSTANAMYLGSMAFPSGLMEAQGILPPPPTQSLSGSRLNVARRMIRRAENILNNLEDPQGTRNRESPPEEPQDEVTPVFAAQVFVPHSHNDDPLASLSAAVSAVESGILQAEQVNRPEVNEENAASNAAAEPATTPSSEEMAAETTETPAASNVPSTSDQPQTPENGTANSNNTSGRLPENSFGTIEMSRLLDDLNKIHDRLRPYMERYHSFMRNDPAVDSEQVQDTRQTQTVINRVSEIMHLLGHAYHSLSDVMVQVNTPPPRPLLCRPILIQHSAVVQAGIPIQVEAQINLTPERRPSENNTTSQQPTGGEAQQNPASEGTNNPPNPPQPSITTSQIRPNVHEIRIDSFPFEFRGFPRPPVFNLSQQPPQQQQPPLSATGNNDSGTQATVTSGSETNTTGQQGQHEPVVAVVPPFVNNPNMEFFMEVTPESITIDSLETTVVTSAAQADNVLRGTFGSAPPEFIQSILQAVAGQMMGGPAQSNPTNQPPTTTASTETSEQTTTAQPSAATNGSNVNSQARGNTQTHPTTATQTRSTSRPHVHLAQHTMQGFDPFLPCNSHHIRRRRAPTTATTAMSANSTNSTSSAATENSGAEQINNNQFPNPLYNILQGWFRSLGTRNQQSRERTEQQENTNSTTAPPPPPPPPTTTTTTAATTETPVLQEPLAPEQLPIDFSDLSRLIFEPRNLGQAVTLDTFLQHFPDHQYNEGESLFTDLVMTLARGLTFSDLISLSTGHIDPLVRIRPSLRTFFRNRVLEGECPTQAAIDRGANRLIAELQPILELMNTMRVRDNIDIVESATQLCRNRFPNIISLLMSRMTGSLRSLVDQCLLTIRQLCALALYSCEDGQDGVEEVFRALITRYTVGIAPEIHQWAISTSLSQLRHFLRILDISSTAIQPFIVIRATNEVPNASGDTTEPEAMECEEAPVVEATIDPTPVPTLNSSIDSDPLSNVVVGSEPWHGNLSAGWIPIITRDSQRQRRQSSQPPFSDAYLSGMPSKRRKIVAASKPHGSLSQVIADGIRRAVTATGLTNSTPVDVVAQAASSDINLQAAYRDLLRSSVQSGLRDNPDFTPDRFPNASNYFNIK